MDELLNNAPCGFLSFGDDGVLLTTNATVCDWLGHDHGALEGMHIGSILSPGGRIFYQTHFFPLLRMQRHIEEIYVALRGRTGEDLPVLLYGRRFERNGEFVNDCVVVPMHQRRRFEDELLKAKRSAEAANKAKAKFLSMMSHELRTPLHSVMLQIDALSTGLFGDVTAEQLEALERVSSASEYLLGLINDILGFARLEAGRIDVNPTNVSTSTAIERARVLTATTIDEAEVRFIRERDEDEYEVLADPDRLQQILLNLLSNAAKFTPKGGEIRVGCERMGDRVAIYVRDTGCGVEPEELERIFEPFVQAEQSAELKRKGAGLGLAISRELARAMGGELTAASTPRVGSTFTLTLPLATTIAPALMPGVN